MTLKIQNNIDNINLKKTSAAQIAAEKKFWFGTILSF